MVRAKSCFEVCQYADQNSEATLDGEDRRQLFTEDEISEDVVLGSRLHAGGFKGVFIAENLATGEVRVSPLGDSHVSVDTSRSVSKYIYM